MAFSFLSWVLPACLVPLLYELRQEGVRGGPSRLANKQLLHFFALNFRVQGFGDIGGEKYISSHWNKLLSNPHLPQNHLQVSSVSVSYSFVQVPGSSSRTVSQKFLQHPPIQLVLTKTCLSSPAPTRSSSSGL